MDIARPDIARRLRRRRLFVSTAIVLVVAALSVAVSRLKPAAPRVDQPVYTDTVRRGEMLRQVRGNGTLVPEQIQYVQAATDGRIERILALPGAPVQPDTILVELSNPELEQQAFELEWQLKAAEAGQRKLLVQLASERLTQESAIATLKAEQTQARLEAEADAVLAKDGLVPDLTMRRSRAKADELLGRLEIEQKRLAIKADSDAAQQAVQEAEIARLQASLQLMRSKVRGLKVRAELEGVLQQIGDVQTLQVGQRVSVGTTLAKIVEPTKLKAEIKIPETQARDVQIGLRADIDTRNGIIPGRVTRVDPAAKNGTVTVDVALDAPLPRGARPDLSVDGVVELERLHDAIHVGRPVHAQTDSTIGLFKLVEEGAAAVRVPVKIGRVSVSAVEIVDGLQPGDQVVLSDMSQWDDFDRLRLK